MDLKEKLISTCKLGNIHFWKLVYWLNFSAPDTTYWNKVKYVGFSQADCLVQLHEYINDLQVAPVILYTVNEKTLKM